MIAQIIGLGTALPQWKIDNSLFGERMIGVLKNDRATDLIRRIVDRSVVKTRFSCVSDFTPGAGEQLFLNGELPTIRDRMAVYERVASELAALACLRAFSRTPHVSADGIDHIIVVTCTGACAPGVDVKLVKKLGLKSSVQRTMVGFMGCHGAINGLHAAMHSIKAGSRYVLVVCVELCTLHFAPNADLDNVVSHMIFGDGAAACILGADLFGFAGLKLEHAASDVASDFLTDMTWKFADTHLAMTLSVRVPQVIEEHLARFVDELSSGHSIKHWCIHPGGRPILDAVQRSLHLPDTALEKSRLTLANIGNVSSGSVLFVLDKILTEVQLGERGLMMAFGPGLSFEGIRFIKY